MATPKLLLDAVGTWSGSSELHLSWLPEGERVLKSNSTLRVETDRHNAFAQLTYTWTHDAEEQDGTILVASDESGIASAGWSDSWHQSSAVMALKGEARATVNLNGHYSVEGHPDWGWRIQLSMSGSSLVLEMFNISPEGEEEWAVRGTYQRT